MSNEIDVFITSQSEDLNPIKHLINAFSSKSDSGRTFANINSLNIKLNESLDPDYQLIMEAFANSSPDKYVIICKETTVTVASSREIFNVLEKVIENANDDESLYPDLFYLAFWANRCDLYHNIRETGNTGIKIVNSAHPNGIQCLMISPKGREKFNNKWGINKNPIPRQGINSPFTTGNYLSKFMSESEDPNLFYTMVTTPALMSFDITRRTSDKDFIKTVECRGRESSKLIKTSPQEPIVVSGNIKSDIESNKEPTSTVKNKNSSNMGVFWFIIIIFIIICFISLLAYFSIVTPIDNSTVINTIPKSGTYG